MGKATVPRNNSRAGSRSSKRGGSAKGVDEAVGLGAKESRSNGGVIEVDPTIPDPPRKPTEARVGLGVNSKRGRNRDTAAANDRAAEIIGAHSELPQVLPFNSGLSFAFRHIGGVPAAIEAARLVAEKDERFKRLVFAYDEVSETDQKKLKLEALCDVAEISHEDFMGAVIAALFKRNTDIGKLIAAANHPKVVEATIEHAQKVNGFMDRKMMHDHVGFLPLPKGTNINIDNSKKTLVATGQPSELGPGKHIVEDTSRTALPSFEDDTMGAARAIRGDAGVGSVGQKRLPAPKASEDVLVPGVVEAEFEDVQP